MRGGQFFPPVRPQQHGSWVDFGKRASKAPSRSCWCYILKPPIDPAGRSASNGRHSDRELPRGVLRAVLRGRRARRLRGGGRGGGYQDVGGGGPDAAIAEGPRGAGMVGGPVAGHD